MLGIKGPYPCGSEPFWGPGQASTVLHPGKVKIIVEEVVNHVGAPFRIALSPMNDNYYNRYVLLDHMPHNDIWGRNYSFDNPKVYSIEINIPDIDCPRCSLQALNVMTDKLPSRDLKCCTYPDEGDGYCFSVYHSCANVRIPGKIPIADYSHVYTGPCGPYAQISANWTQNADHSWFITDPNYIRAINNTCAGWQRNCVINTPEGVLLSASTPLEPEQSNSEKGWIVPVIVLMCFVFVVTVASFNWKKNKEEKEVLIQRD